MPGTRNGATWGAAKLPCPDRAALHLQSNHRPCSNYTTVKQIRLRAGSGVVFQVRVLLLLFQRLATGHQLDRLLGRLRGRVDTRLRLALSLARGTGSGLNRHGVFGPGLLARRAVPALVLPPHAQTTVPPPAPNGSGTNAPVSVPGRDTRRPIAMPAEPEVPP